MKALSFSLAAVMLLFKLRLSQHDVGIINVDGCRAFCLQRCSCIDNHKLNIKFSKSVLRGAEIFGIKQLKIRP
jgi:hypothetical protein